MIHPDDGGAKPCVLYDRECVECGECDQCDLDPRKTCDNCGKCLADADWLGVRIDGLLTDDERLEGEDAE